MNEKNISKTAEQPSPPSQARLTKYGDEVGAIYQSSIHGSPRLIDIRDDNGKLTGWQVQNGEGVLVGRFTVGSNAKTDDYRKGFASNGWLFRASELDDRLMVQSGGKLEYISDLLEATILMKMHDLGFSAEKKIKLSMKRIAFENPYHPIKEWIEALPPYDPKENKRKSYIAQLSGCIKYHDDHAKMGTVYLRKWLIGSIFRLYTGAQNAALVWDGTQGKGKSSLVKWLAIRPEWFSDNSIGGESKDELASLTTVFVQELAELDATTRKAAVAALKAILTRETVTYRPPYGHHAITKPALTNFIGTVNAGRAGILKDQTGNRRFHVVEVTNIDFKYSKIIDPVNIWREALYLYRSGETSKLDEEQAAERDRINSDFQSISPVIDWASDAIEITEDREDRIMPIELKDRFLVAMGKPMTRTDKSEINTWLIQRGALVNQRYSGHKITRRAKWRRI